jgi:hypothetical protein
MQFDDIDFIIIGAAKSATTWLQQRLQADPAVYMPDPELHYFSREYDRGSDWYLSQFEDEGRGKTVGEKSNSYLYMPEAAERLHRDLPHVQLVAQLRNPVARAYSGYCMLYRRGEIGSDIASYLDPSISENVRLLGAGNFASYLQYYIDLFGREKLLILFFEGVSENPDQQMQRVRTHLGLPPRALASEATQKVKDKTDPRIPPQMRRRLAWMKPIVRPLRGNAAFEAARGLIARQTEYPPLPDDLRKRLNEYYAPSIEALEQMSGQSLNHWYEPVMEASG